MAAFLPACLGGSCPETGVVSSNSAAKQKEIPGRICILGIQSWEPNQDAARWFLDAIWPQIAEARPDAQLTIAGSDPPDWLKARQDDRVHVPGFVDDLEGLLSESAVLCIPLRIGGGMRVKLLEYFARGKAVVSTRVGAEGNRARHDQHVVLADEAEDFARAVLTLLDDPQRRAALGDAGRRLAEENYSWDAIAAQFEQAYLEAMDMRGVSADAPAPESAAAAMKAAAPGEDA